MGIRDDETVPRGGRVSGVMRTRRLLLVAAAATLALGACGDDSTTGSSAIDDAACAPADGSAAKQSTFTAAPPMCLVDGTHYTAAIETSKGTVHVALRDDIAPNAVNSFVNLARFHYFDATTCHRAIQGFVVQCGDPTATGNGGPGYEFDDELDQIEPYQVGSVAMANSGPDTNGSQFFIITGDQGAQLPPNYTLFGQVTDGFDTTVKAMEAAANPDPSANGVPPTEPITITKVTINEA